MKIIKVLWSVMFAFLIVLIYATISSFFVSPESNWYMSLIKPANTPKNWVISLGWAVNYVFSITVLARLVFSRKNYMNIVFLVIIGFFNIVWSISFFACESTSVGFLIQMIIVILSGMAWYSISNTDKASSLLYLPILFWNVYLTFFGLNIMFMNNI